MILESTGAHGVHLRQLYGKYHGKNQEFYITFIEPNTAFDTASNQVMWKILKRFGCPGIFQHGYPSTRKSASLSQAYQQPIIIAN